MKLSELEKVTAYWENGKSEAILISDLRDWFRDKIKELEAKIKLGGEISAVSYDDVCKYEAIIVWIREQLEEAKE